MRKNVKKFLASLEEIQYGITYTSFIQSDTKAVPSTGSLISPWLASSPGQGPVNTGCLVSVFFKGPYLGV